MNKFYKTDYVGNSGKTLLQDVLDALPRVDVVDEDENVIGTRPQWESVSSHGSHNIQATNKGIVEVIADDDVLALLDADPRFPIAGEPFAVDKDGNPDEVKRAEYQAILKTARSTERQRKHKVQKQVDGVDETIAEYAKRNVQASALIVVYDADVVDLQLLGNALDAYEVDGLNEQAIYDGLTELFPKLAEAWIKRLATDRPKIFENIQSTIDREIADIQRRGDKLSVEITQRTDAVSGVIDDGQNLTQRKAELATKLEAYPS